MSQTIANKLGLKQILFICIASIICIATLGLGLGLGLGTGSRNDNPAEASQNENRVLPRGVTQVSAGNWHTMAIDSQGNLWAFGSNNRGQLGMSTNNSSTPINITAQAGNPLYGKQIVQVSAGERYTAAIDIQGNLWTFGVNDHGQLGNMTTSGESSNSTPINITAQTGNPLNGRQIVQVSASRFHTMAIDASGNLWAFGGNSSGRLGIMTSGTTNSTPINLSAPHNASTNPSGANNPLLNKQFVQVSAGDGHTVAIDSQGNLWAFGSNHEGQLGNMTTSELNVKNNPISITAQAGNPLNGKQIVQVSTGYYHTMVIDSTGNLWAFGQGTYGELGNMSITQNNSTPRSITAQSGNPLYGKQIAHVSAGHIYTMVIDSQSNLWAFGSNSYGEFGNLSDNTSSSTPINVTAKAGSPLNGKQIIKVAAGNDHTMAIDAQGNLWSFGYNSNGELGNMTTSGNSANSTPINITAQANNPIGQSKFGRMQISAGGTHTMAIDAVGNLWAFGYNYYGQLGNMSNATINSTPINITAQSGNPLYGKQIVQVSAGNYHTMAIDSQGNLWAFGSGSDGRLGNMSTTETNSTPICITTQSGNPLYGKQIVQVSAGSYHTIAIDSAGSLWAFGRNNYGQLGNISTSSSGRPINLSAPHNAATNPSGVDNPLNGKQIVQISAGWDCSIAIDSQGNMWVFGYNLNGRLGNMSTTDSSTPINITAQSGNPLNGKQIVQISSGSHAMAIDAQGNMWAFGSGSSGQLGNMSTTSTNSTPINITAQSGNSLYGKQIVQVSAGDSHTMAIDAQGNLWAFGSGTNGRLGNMSTAETNSTPINITAQAGNSLNSKQIIQVSAGGYHTTVLDSQGNLWAFGNGSNGRLGNASNDSSSTPIKIFIPPIHVATSATISGSPEAKISARTNFTTGWGTITASGGTFINWTPNALIAPGVIKNDSTQEGRIRYEFDANGINTISALSINGTSVSITGYSSLTLWNSILYLRIIQADSNRRLIVEMDRISIGPVAIAVTTTNNARATATVTGSTNARISVRTDFTTGWGVTTASGGTYTDWTASSLTSPDIARNDSTQTGRIRYEFDANGINTISAMTINGSSINLTGYASLAQWNSLLYLRIISADSGRRLIVELDRIDADQPVTIAVTTTNIARATATITGSLNARISVRTDFTTGWGTETASGGTYINWTADTLTSPDVNRNDSTQAGRIRYEFDAAGINTISTLTINGIDVTINRYPTFYLWNSTLYLRIIQADSNRRLIVEMDRIDTDQLVTLAVATTRNVKHDFKFSDTSHISSRLSVDFGEEITSFSNTYSPTWTGYSGTIDPTILTFTSQASFSKITISRPNLADVTITSFAGFLTTLAPSSGLIGTISNTTGATNTITITLNGTEQYEYTWTIETLQTIQVQQILNPPAGATSVANPALLTLNSSSGEGWADLALASPADLFDKTFAGWYTHPDYTKGTLITTVTELQQHITATGGAIVFLYARWA